MGVHLFAQAGVLAAQVLVVRFAGLQALLVGRRPGQQRGAGDALGQIQALRVMARGPLELVLLALRGGGLQFAVQLGDPGQAGLLIGDQLRAVGHCRGHGLAVEADRAHRATGLGAIHGGCCRREAEQEYGQQQSLIHAG